MASLRPATALRHSTALKPWWSNGALDPLDRVVDLGGVGVGDERWAPLGTSFFIALTGWSIVP